MLTLLTYYSPSHREMCQRFVLERASGFGRVIAREFPEQVCPSGAFKHDGWNDAMLQKIDAILSLPVDGSPVVYVDADVCLKTEGRDNFFASMVFAMMSVADWCNQEAIMFSDDSIQWCCGVMAFWATPEVMQFWRTVRILAEAWNLPDQDVIHQLRVQVQQTEGKFPLVPVTIGRQIVSNWASVNHPSVPAPWDGEPFKVPGTCSAWHANWTIGVENKWSMLEEARRQMDAQASS